MRTLAAFHGVAALRYTSLSRVYKQVAEQYQYGTKIFVWTKEKRKKKQIWFLVHIANGCHASTPLASAVRHPHYFF